LNHKFQGFFAKTKTHNMYYESLNAKAPFARNSTSTFSLSSQLFFGNHPLYQNSEKPGICRREAYSNGSNGNHVTNKSHDQKTSNTRKPEMENKSDLSLSQGSGTDHGASLRTSDSRKMPSFANRKRERGGK
jgi:hypothetical protein